MILAGSETPNERALDAFQVGDGSPTGLHQLVWFDPEHIVPRARCCPHLGPLQQIRIDEDTKLRDVAERRHAAIGLGNLSIAPSSMLQATRRNGWRLRYVAQRHPHSNSP